MATEADRDVVLRATEEFVETRLRAGFMAAGRRPSAAASTARVLTPIVMELLFDDHVITQARHVVLGSN